MKKDLIPKKRTGRPPEHALYMDLTSIDGRTKVGKAINGLKSHLRDFVGEATPATEILIQRIAYKTVRLGLYEVAFLSSPGTKEKDHYLPMSNSLRLDLQALQMLSAKPKSPDLEQNIKQAYGGSK